MNRIAIAKETIQITAAGEYQYNSETVLLPAADFDSVVVITPTQAQELLDEPLPDPEQNAPCKIEVTTEDTFAAAQRLGDALVLNFANAHHPGGGFLLGATAQEEALCRCSTLYASINSTAAAEMYRYNNLHIRATDSDYMLLSRDVSVFRDPNCELLPEPFSAAVITAPAPNRRGAAVLTGKKTLEQTFLRRAAIILRAAVRYGYKNLVLGAWGCGAFGNDPDMVAKCFQQALAADSLTLYFDTVCFAVYGSEDSKNYQAFKSVFK